MTKDSPTRQYLQSKRSYDALRAAVQARRHGRMLRSMRLYYCAGMRELLAGEDPGADLLYRVATNRVSALLRESARSVQARVPHEAPARHHCALCGSAQNLSGGPRFFVCEQCFARVSKRFRPREDTKIVGGGDNACQRCCGSYPSRKVIGGLEGMLCVACIYDLANSEDPSSEP